MRRAPAPRSAIGAVVALFLSIAGAEAFDDAKYPDLRGQWRRIETGTPLQFNARRPPGNSEEAPLTPEYQKVFEANVAVHEAGGQGVDPSYRCFAPGMPRIANFYTVMEIVVVPETTYIFVEHIHDDRRIYTDGRDWPDPLEPSFTGYSIGKWIDTDGDGRYDTLEVETRGFKGPRMYDSTGIPLHDDNQTIVRERIYFDKDDSGLLHDEVMVIDHALTRPWVINKGLRRVPVQYPIWHEEICAEGNNHVEVGDESYFLSSEGYLMPTRKDQPPPDLRYFKK